MVRVWSYGGTKEIECFRAMDWRCMEWMDFCDERVSDPVLFLDAFC
jgi:hypothetical protein